MGGLFSKPSKPKPPPIPPPAPLPEIGPEPEDYAARQSRRRRGWQKTIVTGSLVPEPKKKTLLG